MQFRSIEQLSSWFIEVLSMLPKSAKGRTLVAHSFGATVLALALTSSIQDIDGAVFCSPFWKTATSSGLTWKDFRMVIDNYEEVVQSFIVHSLEKRVDKEVVQIMTDKILEHSKPISLIQFFEFLSFLPQTDFSRTNIPCLLIIGNRDKVVNPSNAQHLHSLLPNSNILIMNEIGHFPMIEDLDSFNETLCRFLGTIPHV